MERAAGKLARLTEINMAYHILPPHEWTSDHATQDGTPAWLALREVLHTAGWTAGEAARRVKSDGRTMRRWLAAPETPSASPVPYAVFRVLIEDAWKEITMRDQYDISLAPIDIGFDPRVHDMQVEIGPDVSRVRYEVQAEDVEDRETRVATGTIEQIVRELAGAGYDLVVDHTADGRNIEFDRKRLKYTVQPHNDNYLIRVDTLGQAHDAHLHPEKYR